MASGTTVAQSHRLPCTPQEVSRAACLNGGTCFAWDSGGGTRSVGCSCTSEWTGNRCEYTYLEPDDWALAESSGTIVLAVVLPLLLTFVIVTVLVFFFIKKKRRDKKRQQLQRNSAVSVGQYESKNDQLQRPTVSPQNGQSKVRYDSPDMSSSTQVTGLSDSQRYSCNGNQTVPAVFWESAV